MILKQSSIDALPNGPRLSTRLENLIVVVVVVVVVVEDFDLHLALTHKLYLPIYLGS